MATYPVMTILRHKSDKIAQCCQWIFDLVSVRHSNYMLAAFSALNVFYHVSLEKFQSLVGRLNRQMIQATNKLYFCAKIKVQLYTLM